MQKIAAIILLLFAITFSSCIRDFEEGADISFRSVTNRIAGEWTLDGVWVNGIDSTTLPPYNKYYGKQMINLSKEDVATDRYDIYGGSYNPSSGPIGGWHYFSNGKFNFSINRGGNIGDTLFNYVRTEGFRIICCRNNRLVIACKDTSSKEHRYLFVK